MEGICGGEPKIVGSRITVALIADLHNKCTSVDDIVARYPHLNYAQIYDALSYYYENKEEIDRYIRENTEESIRKKYKGAPWLR
ncbi:MAG: DUF433 domain-containing protein [bacterium]